MARSSYRASWIVASALIIISAPGLADRDKSRDAREEAQRKESALRNAEHQRKMQGVAQDAQLKTYRGLLGAKATGKSDAEVIQMGKQWEADMRRQAGK
ncbi:hypothetical protein [Ottowia thiooxydans]|uniref:hypothetical protein n=1 Tax=Ottowia thiooxydans TaxID=219182 RepID=UPI0004074E35|nr:hypothetical protein [Ottowia thiooxydans]